MRDLEFKDVLSALTHIRGGIPALRLSSRIRLGEHKSLFFGQGDFFDIKEFDPDVDMPNMKIDLDGDEDTEYARRCIEAHETHVKFLVDLSQSIYAGIDHNRRRMLLEAVGFIGLTAVRFMDPVGVIGFTDRVVLDMPDKTGRSNFYYYLKTVYDLLESNDPAKKKLLPAKTDFLAALDFIRRCCNKPCFIPVISDFVGFEKVVDSPLLRHVASRHELIFIFLDDPLEFLSARGSGYVSLDDPESGKRVSVSRKDLPEIERDLRARRRYLRKKQLQRMGIDCVVLEYGANGRHFNRLYRFFTARHKLQSRHR
ncbi:MAG: hypothetical protein A3C71_02780 [Candidatus Yanofskybacteria bacterium RIFCSPHIGHO2_02_FULL_43_15c]|uniref:DUF58 domain-containing protein n=2 Tax=Candidatus Yanofskyibacteriota TaxID=1752733 RepID=A0A1F8ECQ9_9BACT|nr:MAG: hypothetical protein A2649_00125 [Candidatus Yanofskybacteria bacterium RIFCSPHIGHO2_01_FULL_41_26]OGN12757.1 MAG: hypothetical protein A3C71_02780 [Candidatus Yanofskybacteria bacterium RIFCSPHIGHO2_02_FULL_43_15c]OGN21456.1 MAG: hypothetical protein A2915_02040 [Candidatus Yanofskybacteria bacterium RIFCSPLOWO2_01_FULL_41_34]